MRQIRICRIIWFSIAIIICIGWIVWIITIICNRAALWILPIGRGLVRHPAGIDIRLRDRVGGREHDGARTDRKIRIIRIPIEVRSAGDK